MGVPPTHQFNGVFPSKLSVSPLYIGNLHITPYGNLLRSFRGSQCKFCHHEFPLYHGARPRKDRRAKIKAGQRRSFLEASRKGSLNHDIYFGYPNSKTAVDNQLSALLGYESPPTTNPSRGIVNRWLHSQNIFVSGCSNFLFPQFDGHFDESPWELSAALWKLDASGGLFEWEITKMDGLYINIWENA